MLFNFVKQNGPKNNKFINIADHALCTSQRQVLYLPLVQNSSCDGVVASRKPMLLICETPLRATLKRTSIFLYSFQTSHTFRV